MALNKLLALLLGGIFLLGTTAMATAQTQQQPPAPKPAEKPAATAKAGPKSRTATGSVKSVSADSLVVEVGKKEMTFALGGDAAQAAQKLKAGDRVTVGYSEAEGKMTATKVTPRPAKAAKKAAEPGAAKPETPAPAQPKQ
jgi:ribosomal 50S subunit-recycling heat shock protein